jgi:hypothetical protein
LTCADPPPIVPDQTAAAGSRRPKSRVHAEALLWNWAEFHAAFAYSYILSVHGLNRVKSLDKARWQQLGRPKLKAGEQA